MRLVPIHLHLEKAANPNPTGDRSLPGAIIQTDAPDSVLFLLRGKHLRRLDTVPTFFLGKARLAPRDSLAMSNRGPHDWILCASKGSPVSRSESNEKVFELQLRHRPSGVTQSLSTHLSATSAEIQWVGDLDGDGRVDLFIMDDTHESGARNWILYLSSLARGKDLVGKAAEFWLPGC